MDYEPEFKKQRQEDAFRENRLAVAEAAQEQNRLAQGNRKQRRMLAKQIIKGK